MGVVYGMWCAVCHMMLAGFCVLVVVLVAGMGLSVVGRCLLSAA